MEESENRKQRLKAMRLEAEQGAGADSETSASGSHGLCNPLAESETSVAPQYTAPRFDFYTDPMAAFSNKRKSSGSPQVAQGYAHPRPVYPDAARSPAYPNPAIRYPHERVIQAPTVHYNQSPSARPVQAANTFAPQGNPPSAWGGSGAAVNYSFPSYISQATNYQNPGFGRGDSSYSTYGRGRGQWNNNTNYESGRGRGQWNNNTNYESGRGRGQWNNNTNYESGRGRGRWHGNRMNPGPGFSGRGGRAASDLVDFKPYLYYRKEMAEDPWITVQLVPWEAIAPLVSNKPWTSKPNHLKKAKVSAHSHGSVSQPSLAEYLASSFNESAPESAADIPST